MTTINLSKMNTGTGAIPSLTQTVLSRIEIPVPPLEVQRKIVEVLDNFSELTAELTAELEARQKQYEYYRDNLLNFNRGGQEVSDVKWMKMSEVGTFTRGRRFVRADIVEQGYALGIVPDNFKIVLSAWNEYKPENKFNLPVAWYDDGKHPDLIPSDGFVCPGNKSNCKKCQFCFHAKNGANIILKKH